MRLINATGKLRGECKLPESLSDQSRDDLARGLVGHQRVDEKPGVRLGVQEQVGSGVRASSRRHSGVRPCVDSSVRQYGGFRWRRHASVYATFFFRPRGQGIMSTEDEALSCVVRKAVELGLLPRSVGQDQYLVNVEKVRQLVAVIVDAHALSYGPSFRAGFAAAEAARTPGPDVSRLLAAAKYFQAGKACYCDECERHKAAIAEHESTPGGAPCSSVS
jgi:hypothetical protein